MNSAAPAAALKVLLGLEGANRVWHLPGTAAAHRGTCATVGTCRQGGVVVFFVGDQLEGGVPAEVLAAQEPKAQAAAMAKKWPGWDVLVVIPSRLEAGASCFDHFLNRTTRTGEPLGYQGHTLKAARQLWSLMGAAGVLGEDWRQHAAMGASELEDLQARKGALFPSIAIVGFSKGGVVVSQLLTEMGHCRSLSAGRDAQPSSSDCSSESQGCDWVTPSVANRPTLTAQRASPTVPENGGLCGGRPRVVPPPEPVEPSQLLSAVLSSISELHYCDAGLHCRGAFMNDPRVGEQMACSPSSLSVRLHCTPRQLRDPSRPWIEAEAESCVSVLQKAGVDAKLLRYFWEEDMSISMHFRTITAMEVGRQQIAADMPPPASRVRTGSSGDT